MGPVYGEEQHVKGQDSQERAARQCSLFEFLFQETIKIIRVLTSLYNSPLPSIVIS